MQIGFGTAAIGRPQYINIKEDRISHNFDLGAFKDQGMQMLNYAFEKGIRYFDTAPGYGFAEDLLIEWLSDKNGENIELATKWGYTYVAGFKSDPQIHEVKEHSIHKLNEQWRQSNKLLPFLSTYQIHSATFETGVLENSAILHRLAELKALYNLKIGFSTSGSNQLEVLKAGLNVHVEGNPLFDVFQVSYNILDQSIASIFQDSITLGKRFIIKEALANGRLFPNKDFAHYFTLYEYLKSLASKYNSGIDAIALRFCFDTIHPFMILSGGTQKQHITENLKAQDLELIQEEIHVLEQCRISPGLYWKERKSLPWN